jgi:putative ABC transport system permease protein
MFTQMKIFEINEGRYFNLNEKGVAILGKGAAEDVFEKNPTIGDTVSIKGINFKIIGVLKSTANRMRDNSIFIPMDQLRDMTDSKDSLTMVIAKVPDLDKIEKIADKIEEELDDEYGEGFYDATTTQQIAENVGSIFAVISFVLGGIASIALVVAGVGIANTMFTSVMERTKEIGIMKAIGATNIDIMQIFLIESSLLGLLGGVVGLFVGFLLSSLITIIAEGALPIPFKTVISLEMAIGALLFSIIVGIISGIFPARTAANLQPVDALRR